MRIQLERLEHVFEPDVRALDGVELEIPAGQSVALVGANGSGKTTLLRHLDGLLRPTAGRVLIGGDDAAGLSVAQLASRVGLAFQEPDRQIFARSVRAEVRFGPHHLGLGRPEQDRAVETALAATGLADDGERHPYDLGPAGRKLLSIASVLAMQTPVVALDEPTSGLDSRSKARVGAIIEGLRSSGRTIIAVSHQLTFVAEHFERVIVMSAGQVVVDGTPAAVLGEDAWPILERAGLEPTPAARLGASLGLGSTPTDAALAAALAGGPASARAPRRASPPSGTG